MRVRAAVLIIKNNQLAVIKRIRQNKIYYAIPGGGLNEAEYTRDAAIREALEELGVLVTIKRLTAIVERVEQGKLSHIQFYYEATIRSGSFGSGTGEEYSRPEKRGTYTPTWLAIDKLYHYDLYPRVLAELIFNLKTLPTETVHLTESIDYPRSSN